MDLNLNYSIRNIFTVPIHIFDVNRFNEIKNELIDYAYNLKKEDEGVFVSNYGGWQSSSFDIVNEDDVLQSFLINCLSEFPPIKKSVLLRCHAWININKPGDYNIMHYHPKCDLSGVIWLKAPKDCGNIEFDSPFTFQTYNEVESYTDDFRDSNNYNHTYYFNPIEGRIIVFPSHLQHHVLHNKSEEDRISVSFNIRLKNG